MARINGHANPEVIHRQPVDWASCPRINGGAQKAVLRINGGALTH